MLDKWSSSAIKPFLEILTSVAVKLKFTPNQVTIVGFLLGVVAFFLITQSQFIQAMGFILLNRIMDGIDGILARKQSPTDRGGFLDICLDFLFYAMIPLAFIINNPTQNGIAGGVLIFSFVGTGSTFLAYAISAEKWRIPKAAFKSKSFTYLGGIAEGTETIIFFILFALFPHQFPFLAYLFSGLCFLTTTTRIYTGYNTIKNYEEKK